MLQKSGINLESSAIHFVESNNYLTLFCAYVKLEELKLINASKHINRIIVRWEIRDLCLGVSDIELYDYCKDQNIALYRNSRIHLKVFWDNSRKILFGSANLTERGIGEKGKFNYELNGNIDNIDYQDISYLNSIIINSEYVTAALFDRIKNLVIQTNLPTLDYPVLDTIKNKEDYFLLSNLPMTESVDKLYKSYNDLENLNTEELNCVTHDLALYDVPQNLSKSDFQNHLKEAFNLHPFIVEFKNHIKSLPGQSLNYGGVVRWIQENTTTVPTPRSWELKKDLLVNILYQWICDLDNGFTYKTPNFSQVIKYKQ